MLHWVHHPTSTMEYNRNMTQNPVTSITSRLGTAALALILAMTAVVGLSAPPAAAATTFPVFNNAQLSDVTCVSATDCWAVGNEAAANATGVGLFVHFDGTNWTAFQAPVPSGNISLVINAIDCTTTDNCWAVGVDSFTGIANHVIEHWDGTSWSLTTPASAQNYTTRLSAVQCVSASDCWAVGDSDVHSFFQHFDGSTWNTASAPDGFYRSVTCAASNNCWAGGDGASPLVHFNGSSWIADPTFGASIAPQVADVTCVSTSDCWMFNRGVYHYDGVGWTQALSTSDWLSTLGVTDTTGTLAAHVSCGSSTDCWVVTVGASAAPLSAHWDGSVWTFSSTLTPGAFNNVQGLDCSTGSCVAVGSSSLTNSSPAQSLIEHTDTNGMPLVMNSFMRAAAVPTAPLWILDNTPGVWSFISLPASVGISMAAPDAPYAAPVTDVANFSVKIPVKGTVTFSDNGVAFKTVKVAAGATKASTVVRKPAVGVHSITAAYTPAAPYLPITSSAVTQTISLAATTTTLTQVVGLHNTTYSVRVKRVAPSVGYAAGGTATVLLNGVPFSTVTVSALGAARFVLPNNTATVTVTYNGSATDLPS